MIHYLITYMHFLDPLTHGFNSLDFRIVLSFLTSFFMVLIAGKHFIHLAKKLFRSPVRDYTPTAHQAKTGTPSMGGLLVIGIACIALLIWCSLANPSIWLLILSLIGFGAIGLWDDSSKIIYHKGISERKKSFAQIGVSAFLILSWFFLTNPETTVCLPFLSNYCLDIGFLLIPWALFIIIATSNAVNLTDGLDGLAIRIVAANFATFAVIAYMSGLSVRTTELVVGGAILTGVCLGFLVYNKYPAQIFMGDVGSLALGGTLGLFAVMTRHELLLPITGVVLVVETVSVMIQVFVYKLYKIRFFNRAPLHHHFELAGWHETKVTRYFSGATFITCILVLIIYALK